MIILKSKALKVSTAVFALSAAFSMISGAMAQRKAPAKAATKPAADVLTIINSGDRLSPGYRVTVTPFGAVHGVVRTRSGKTTIDRRDQMIAPTRDRLFEDLRDAAPLDRLSANGTAATPQNNRQQGRRGRGGGLGNRTQAQSDTARVTGPQVFVVYRGVRSPNLRAASDDKGKELYQRVKQAIEVVRLPIPNVP